MLKKKASFLNVKDMVISKTKPSNSTTNGSNGSQNQGENQNQSSTVDAPTISGTTPFTESTSVTMSGPDEAEIRYTIDGSDPTAESTLYSEAISLTDTTTVKAIAIKNGESSEIASKTFTKSSNDGGFDTGN